MTLNFVEHCDSVWVLILRENCFNNNFNFIRKRTCMLHILFEVHQIPKIEVCILVSDCGELGKTNNNLPKISELLIFMTFITAFYEKPTPSVLK